MLTCEFDGFLAVAGLTHHSETVIFQCFYDIHPDERLIFGDNNGALA